MTKSYIHICRYEYTNIEYCCFPISISDKFLFVVPTIHYLHHLMAQPIACLQFCHKCLLCDKNYIKGKGGQRPFCGEEEKYVGEVKENKIAILTQT